MGTKANNFADLLDSSFRWPEVGDRLFVSVDPHTDADLCVDDHSRRWLIAEGFRRAADSLIENLDARDRVGRDSLVYPIAFCYRQYLELAMKNLLASYGSEAEVTQNWETHSLARLWQRVKEVLTHYGILENSGADSVIEQLIAEFDSVDPRSFAFRYPVDTKGNPIGIPVPGFGLSRLKDVMNGVSSYFGGTDDYIWELVSA